VSRHEFALVVLESRRPGRTPPSELVTAGTRAAARHATRPADVSLDASRARGLLATPLLGVRAGLQRVYGPSATS